MTKTTTYLTALRAKELSRELDYLKATKKPEIARLIKDARSLGNLEDNSDYEVYMDQQNLIEGRIREIELILANAVLIESRQNSSVQMGNKVVVEVEGRKDTFYIVGVEEAAPHLGKISHKSPVGQSLLGGKVGQEVLVETEMYSTIYKILNIEDA